MNTVVTLEEKLEQIHEFWHPYTVAELNDYAFKLVKVQGTFEWHSHAATDEAFFCVEGNLTIEMRDKTMHLTKGDLFVVPRGVEHRPRAEGSCSILLVEPADVVNTGDGEPTALTAEAGRRL